MHLQCWEDFGAEEHQSPGKAAICTGSRRHLRELLLPQHPAAVQFVRQVTRSSPGAELRCAQDPLSAASLCLTKRRIISPSVRHGASLLLLTK